MYLDGCGITIEALDDGSFAITIKIEREETGKKGSERVYPEYVQQTVSAKDDTEVAAIIAKYLPALKPDRTSDFEKAFKAACK